MTCCRVISETAMIAAALASIAGHQEPVAQPVDSKRDAQGITYQSSPWQTHTAGHPAREGNRVLGVEQHSIPCRRTAPEVRRSDPR